MTNTIAAKDIKYRHLFFSILIDVIGMSSLFFPFLGELSDIAWAPVSAIFTFIIYRKFKVYPAIFIDFVEEILPFSDFIPTLTLTWFYAYWLKKGKTS